jgi:hypothetical protein
VESTAATSSMSLPIINASISSARGTYITFAN